MPVYSLGSDRQGIVHVIGPELGVTQPGMTIVCGDSHTSTHGAFGALAFGIGTSEVEHVLATQCMVQQQAALDAHPLRGRARLRRHRQGPDPRHARPARRRRADRPRRRVRRPGDRGALDGGPHDRLQHDDRGRRARRHDRARRDHLRVVRATSERPGAPRGRRARRGDRALARAAHRRGRRASTREVVIDAARDLAAGDLGHEPRDGARRHRDACPRPRSSTAPPTARRPNARCTTWRSSPARRSSRSPSTACSSAPARTRASATCAPPPRSSPGARSRRASNAMVVPGSQQVKAQAEAEGLDQVFRDAGFDWRVAGCSMCLGMNPDILAARRALRLDLEPQLRGAPGPRRAHAPRLPADGRRRGDRGALRRHPELELSERATPRRRLAAPRHRRRASSSIGAGAAAAARRAGGPDRAPARARRARRSRASSTSAAATAPCPSCCSTRSPRAEGVLVDFSEPMLERAGARLARFGGRWQARARRPRRSRDWRDALPATVATTRSSRRLRSTTCPPSASARLFAEVFDAARARRHVREHGLSSPSTARCSGLFDEQMAANACSAERAQGGARADAEIEHELHAGFDERR